MRFCIYAILGWIDYVVGRTNPITILAYHGIANDKWRYNISKETLKKQIQVLQQNYTIVSLPEIEAHLIKGAPLKKPCVALTFDDGYKNIMSIKELIKKAGIKPTLFVLSNPTKANFKELGLKSDFLNSKELKSLISDGWTIGNHSATHSDFNTLSEDQAEKEIITSKKTLQNVLNKPIRYFAYPKGRYTPLVLNKIQTAKYSLAVSMDDAKITKNSKLHTLPRVGIDRSHTLVEFKCTTRPSVINFRQFVKQSFIGKYVTI